MLLQLHIENIALIDKLDLRLESGLNVLTGETGAGKSIIIDAVNLVLGGRASSELIRSGCARALVEALFDVSMLPELLEKIGELGLTLEDDGSLLLTRDLYTSGKHTCRVNGRVVTLSMLKELGQYLIDIYGQHDNQSLLNPAKHLFLLDQLGGDELWRLREQFRAIYQQWLRASEQLEQLQAKGRERARQLDIIRFQTEEIDQAALKPGEEEQLSHEARLLASGEKLASLSADAYQMLARGDGRQAGILDALARVISQLTVLAAIDVSQLPVVETVEGCYYQLEDSAGILRHYREGVEFSPDRLARVEDRLDLIKKLKRKYGDSVEQILTYRQQLADELSVLENSSEQITALEDEKQRLLAEGSGLAARLTACRQSTGEKLQEGIQKELQSLMMPQIKFQVCLSPLELWKAHGREDVEFLISPNPGEPLKPLAKIASGGEMSRIMLALKTILTKVDRLPTLIFDEVDAGIGGRTVQAVGEKLALIGRERQVICVTHSPQVSSFATAHFQIAKQVEGGRTTTTVTRLDEEGRVQELARMLGGHSITGTTIKHAEEMLAMVGQKA